MQEVSAIKKSIEKAHNEYENFMLKIKDGLSKVEKNFIEQIDATAKRLNKKNDAPSN